MRPLMGLSWSCYAAFMAPSLGCMGMLICRLYFGGRPSLLMMESCTCTKPPSALQTSAHKLRETHFERYAPAMAYVAGLKPKSVQVRKKICLIFISPSVFASSD